MICVDFNTNKVIKKILFPSSVGLPTIYLNNVRFDLSRDSEVLALITDSSQSGPNGIIVVDLKTDESWRQISNHPSTKAEDIKNFRPILEGKSFVIVQNDGPLNHCANMGIDSSAISS